MQYIAKTQTKKIQNSPTCTAIEYPLNSPAINCAVIKLTGRYPKHGVVMNTECKELAYVMEGGGKIVVEGNEVALSEGDMILIEPNEKFFWDGHLTLLMPCAPAWRPEQYKLTHE